MHGENFSTSLKTVSGILTRFNMILPRDIYATRFEIWNPKWSTRTVKLAAHKIGTHNIVTFPKAKSLAGEWYISGKRIKNYPMTQMATKSGSMLDIYEVKLSDLEPVEWEKVEYIIFDDRTGQSEAIPS